MDEILNKVHNVLREVNPSQLISSATYKLARDTGIYAYRGDVISPITLTDLDTFVSYCNEHPNEDISISIDPTISLEISDKYKNILDGLKSSCIAPKRNIVSYLPIYFDCVIEDIDFKEINRKFHTGIPLGVAHTSFVIDNDFFEDTIPLGTNKCIIEYSDYINQLLKLSGAKQISYIMDIRASTIIELFLALEYINGNG